MKLALVVCANPACGTTYEAAIEKELHLRCPMCSQNNTVYAASAVLTGRCRSCGVALDDHLYGRDNFACPPKRGK